MLGMGMAIVGMVIYSWAVEKAKRANNGDGNAALSKENNSSEEDVALITANSDDMETK
jgi:hypothetical protein